MKLDKDGGHEFDDDDDQPTIYWKVEAQAGASKTFTFTAMENPSSNL